MPAVPACAAIREHVGRHIGQAKRVVGTRSRRPGDAPVPEGFAAAS